MTKDQDASQGQGPDASEYADLVPFHTARSPWEARIVQAVLADAGIPAYVPGGLLTDEFAMSQQLLNLQGVTIQVPRSELEAANATLAAARRAGEQLSEESDTGEPEETEPPDPVAVEAHASGVSWKWMLLCMGLTVIFAVLWLEARNELQNLRGDAVVTGEVAGPGHFLYRWRHNGNLHSETMDHDRNGIAEQFIIYNREGLKVLHLFDQNQNGLQERFVKFNREGRRTSVAEDQDENGIQETMVEYLTDDLKAVWHDKNQDGIYERIEIYATGSRRSVQERNASGEFVTIR